MHVVLIELAIARVSIRIICAMELGINSNSITCDWTSHQGSPLTAAVPGQNFSMFTQGWSRRLGGEETVEVMCLAN